jgi:uncharacterized low-complexity protein
MNKKLQKPPFAGLIGTAIVTSLSATAAGGTENPFELKELDSGYTHVAEAEKAKKEMTCGEGRCGAEMMKNPEMKCGAGMKEMLKQQQEAQQKKAVEGKCAGMAMPPATPGAPETKTN